MTFPSTRPASRNTLVRSAFVLAAAGAAFVAVVLWRLSRYAITGESMTPTLGPGDYVVVDTRAYICRAPSPRELVLARDPREPSRVIAKRVAGPDGADGVVLLGDNRVQSTDSRTFGSVSRGDLAGRVVWCYWPPARFGPVR